MAPVASGVADGKQDWLSAALSFAEGLMSPWPPVDGIVFVLQEIWAGFIRQPVRGNERAIRGRMVARHDRILRDLEPCATGMAANYYLSYGINYHCGLSGGHSRGLGSELGDDEWRQVL